MKDRLTVDPQPLPSPPSSYAVRIDPVRLIVALAAAAFVLLAVHVALTVYHYQVHELPWLPWRQLFDVDDEVNLPTWFSGFLLAFTAAWLWVCAQTKKRTHDAWWVAWYVLALGFLLLSLDEIAGLHESVNSLIEMSWAIPGGITAGIVGVAFLPFLWHLPARTRYTFVLAGLLHVGGAVGMELVGAPMDEETMVYNLTTAVEEGLEMFGVIVFLGALLFYMRRSQAGASQTLAVGVVLTDPGQ